MRPDVVCQLLADVEHKWLDLGVAHIRGKLDEGKAVTAMQQSCTKVANSIIAGSDGERRRVQEYMKEVCMHDKAALSAQMCESFGAGLVDFMKGDEAYNREELKV